VWGQEETYELEIQDDAVVLYDSLEGFDYGETDFHETWRTDVYDNHYFLSTDEDFVQLVPGTVLENFGSDGDDFPELMKHNLAYLTNFTELRSGGVQVPDFQTGVHMEDEKALPYTVMEKPDGVQLSELSQVLDEDREGNMREEFDRYNEKGRELAGANRIIYPAKRSNDDLIVQQGENGRELVYINPGTYIRDAFFNQFNRNSHMPSNRSELGDWLGEEYWLEKISE
jgi:hypothetical protein